MVRSRRSPDGLGGMSGNIINQNIFVLLQNLVNGDAISKFQVILIRWWLDSVEVLSPVGPLGLLVGLEASPFLLVPPAASLCVSVCHLILRKTF